MWQAVGIIMMMMNNDNNDSWWFYCVIPVLFYRVIVQISHSGQIAKYFTAGAAPNITFTCIQYMYLCTYEGKIDGGKISPYA